MFLNFVQNCFSIPRKCNCVISFWLVFSQCEMTGVVVDVGDGATHVVPVAEGYVIGNSIRSIPVSGKDVTLFIEKLMKVLFLLALSKLRINQLLVSSSCKCMHLVLLRIRLLNFFLLG